MPVVIYTGTNDHGEDLSAIKIAQKLVSLIKDQENNVKIAFSSIVHGKDSD